MLADQTDAAAEVAARRHAEELQRRARGWFVVMYSPYWREYIAYYLGECEQGGLTLRAPDPGQLWSLMDHVAPADWQLNALPLVASRPPASRREGAG
ncbi:hypothetical protein [Nonomuraea turcica]|uniref:hypothetical protein n=1 Tax=Nonomuraea sp. G32 TaxID=3067274 RepID=UPI00273B41AC|nr:hypothetical protein [Nonomuraea sp. G32]MDP4511752.1 hypothetical protein [Nonomuraea sp. G32]